MWKRGVRLPNFTQNLLKFPMKLKDWVRANPLYIRHCNAKRRAILFMMPTTKTIDAEIEALEKHFAHVKVLKQMKWFYATVIIVVLGGIIMNVQVLQQRRNWSSGFLTRSYTNRPIHSQINTRLCVCANWHVHVYCQS